MSFRDYLQSELLRRCGKNKRYSLRAFARFLGLDHSTLSQILRGKRSISPALAERCGARLGLDVEQRARLAIGAIRDDAPFKEDLIRVLAEWEHAAIVELAQLECFQPDSRWIARVLGLTTDRVNIVLQRLMRMELLRMESGRWTVRTAVFDLRTLLTKEMYGTTGYAMADPG